MATGKRKRRPTRTPKPSAQKSRFCQPSFLDRSTVGQKLLFGDSDDSEGQSEVSNPLHSDPPDSDEEYDINADLANQVVDDEEYEVDEEEKTANRSVVDALGLENLSICGNQSLLRNARASVKMSKHKKNNKKGASNAKETEEAVMFSPLLLDKTASRIETKLQKENVESAKADEQQSAAKRKKAKTKAKKRSAKAKAKTKAKSTWVRITKSNAVFKRHHKFGTLLVKPAECGSGCPLFRSTWKEQPSVTKLMPLWESEEFTKEENVDNALREFEFHADLYRKRCREYGVSACPVVSILACVRLKHSGYSEWESRDKPKRPYLAFVMPQLHCNLAQFARKYRKLTEAEGMRLLRTGLRFLGMLRETKMVHCDIKPENIFLAVSSEDEEAEDEQVHIDRFVFGDFGCAGITTEEFPYGSLTGTVTMWDLEALGKKHGDEDGFDAQNDLYGVLGSLLDGMYGSSIMEELLEDEDSNGEDTEWSEYTDLIRTSRKRMMHKGFMQRELKELKIKDVLLKTALLQVGKKRSQRMKLEKMMELTGV